MVVLPQSGELGGRTNLKGVYTLPCSYAPTPAFQVWDCPRCKASCLSRYASGALVLSADGSSRVSSDFDSR